MILSSFLATLPLAGCGGYDGPPSQDEQKKAMELAQDFRARYPMPKAKARSHRLH